MPGQPVPSPLKLHPCSRHKDECWAGSLMPPDSNPVLLYMASFLCTLVYFSVKWVESSWKIKGDCGRMGML